MDPRSYSIFDTHQLTIDVPEDLPPFSLRQLMKEIPGVEHVYSTSRTGGAVVTVSFYVGEDREDSLLKLFAKLYSHQDTVPDAVRASLMTHAR